MEQSTDKLVSDEEAKAFFKTLGVIDEEDLGYGSPEKKASKKLDAQEEEAAKAAKELAKRMKAKKKQIEALKAEREKKIQEAALKLEEERKQRALDEEEKRAKEKKDRREEYQRRAEERKNLSFLVKPVSRKSVSELGAKKRLGSDGGEDPAQAYSAAEKAKVLSPINQSHRHTPLYEKIKHDYDQLEERLTLENKKKRLEELRSFNKAVTKTELAEHAMKYEQARLEKRETQKKNLRSAIQQDRERASLLPTFAAVRNSADPDATSGERILAKLKQPGGLLGIQEGRKREEERKKRTYEQVKQYGKQVKEMYLPKANPTKQAEMEKRRKELLAENTATLKPQPINY